MQSSSETQPSNYETLVAAAASTDTMDMDLDEDAKPDDNKENMKDDDQDDDDDDDPEGTEWEEQYDAIIQRLAVPPESTTGPVAVTIAAQLQELLYKSESATSTMSAKVMQVKERIVYDLTRLYCGTALSNMDAIVQLVTSGYLVTALSKAKTAKVVRQILEIVMSLASVSEQERVARAIQEWCTREKRTFLRQRMNSQLAKILFQQDRYVESLDLCDRLLIELKKLDDKQLLVETHLLESQLYFALHNIPKSKAALTASRTAANAIYVSPRLQASLDVMSGTLHTEEGDYPTGHSYFLEAFEQLDTLGDTSKSTSALKYMMLCRILDSLRRSLSSSSASSASTSTVRKEDKQKAMESAGDLSFLLSTKQQLKYAGRDIAAMQAIATAASARDLQEYERVLEQYTVELQSDLLIQHHLRELHNHLLESNLVRVIEPYSVVEIDFVARQMRMPVAVVEKKLGQMILDGKISAILDQGNGHLIVDDELDTDGNAAMSKGLQVIGNMDSVVTSLFERSQALRTMMI